MKKGPAARQAVRQSMADLVLAGLIILGAILLFVGAAELPPPRWEPLGSAALPRILGALLIVFAAIIATSAALRWRRGSAVETPPSEADPRRGVLVFGALVLYVAALDFGRAPFVPATVIFVAAVGLSIGQRNWRNAALFTALGLGLALAISTIFERFLYISIG